MRKQTSRVQDFCQIFSKPILAALLSACAGPARYAYVKEGASSRQTQSAMSKCEYQVRLQKTAAAEKNALIKLCMEGEDYRLKRVN